MLSLKRTLLAAMAAATIAAAQPALTIIQDTLYRADGTRFNGTLFITWSAFQAGDTSNIATSNLTVPIVSGVLKVSLVPTTNATPGAQYNVTFNSRGINQFTQVWAVPPSTLPLRVRDILVSQGSVVGPAPITSSPVQISDITGLQNELNIRPSKGTGFNIGRAAIINQSGQIDAASGNLSDCVKVDGSSGPCGSGGGLTPSFSDAEIPQGTIDGLNNTFTLGFSPSPPASLDLQVNGLSLLSNVDYSLSGNVVTFFAAAIPQPGDSLIASYRYANVADSSSTLAPSQVVCSSVGQVTSLTTDTHLGSCTIPANLLGLGDRLEIRFDYLHTGTTQAFSTTVKVGSTVVMSRAGAALETAVVGKSSFAVGQGGEVWNTQSWSSIPAEALTVGTAAEDTTMPLTIEFRGNLVSGTSDLLNLVDFTVLRHPAQSNP
jgi:hypothetical protein